MKDKKKVVVFFIIIISIIIIWLLFNKLDSNTELNIKPNEVIENFGELNNNTVKVIYNKSKNEVMPNEIILDEEIKLSLDSYQFYYDESRNDYALNLSIEFFKENTKLVNVMYYDILYNKEYVFYGFTDFNKYDEFKNLKYYGEGTGRSVTRKNDEETEENNSIKDVPIFYFHNNIELNDLSLSLYNIKYQSEGDPRWYSIDNERVTFNITISE